MNMHEPSINETAFNCPHCEAYTTQYWHNCAVDFIQDKVQTPFIPPDDFKDKVKAVDEWDREKKLK
ncbi:MAG: hypothetical protein IPG64_24115 [Haliea sp.]|nr:hypothetical protein [Haliea sp.]